jgi:hypothetical protein
MYVSYYGYICIHVCNFFTQEVGEMSLSVFVRKICCCNCLSNMRTVKILCMHAYIHMMDCMCTHVYKPFPCNSTCRNPIHTDTHMRTHMVMCMCWTRFQIICIHDHYCMHMYCMNVLYVCYVCRVWYVWYASFMFLCMHVRTDACLHLWICVCMLIVCVKLFQVIYIHTHTCAHIHMRTDMHTRTRARTHTQHARIHTYTHIHTHTHICVWHSCSLPRRSVWFVWTYTNIHVYVQAILRFYFMRHFYQSAVSEIVENADFVHVCIHIHIHVCAYTGHTALLLDETLLQRNGVRHFWRYVRHGKPGRQDDGTFITRVLFSMHSCMVCVNMRAVFVMCTCAYACMYVCVWGSQAVMTYMLVRVYLYVVYMCVLCLYVHVYRPWWQRN